MFFFIVLTNRVLSQTWSSEMMIDDVIYMNDDYSRSSLANDDFLIS